MEKENQEEKSANPDSPKKPPRGRRKVKKTTTNFCITKTTYPCGANCSLPPFLSEHDAVQESCGLH